MLSRAQLVRLSALALAGMLTGCHKRVRVPPPSLPAAVIPTQPMPTTIPGPPVEAPAHTPGTPSASEPIPNPAPEPAPRRAPRRPAATPPTPTPVPPPKTSAPALDLGTLSEGGSPDNPGDQRAQAQAVIADTDKRLKELPAETRQQKRQQLTQVEQFLTQAREALNSGDPGGANNLATKGKLMLDDVLK